MKLNIYIWKTKFTFHKQCLFGLSMQRRLAQQTKIYCNFTKSVWKETTHKPSDVAAAVCCFDDIFYSMCEMEEAVPYSLSALLGIFNRHVVTTFKTSYLKEIRVLHYFYQTSYCWFSFLHCCFTLWIFHIFLYIKFKKNAQGISRRIWFTYFHK